MVFGVLFNAGALARENHSQLMKLAESWVPTE